MDRFFIWWGRIEGTSLLLLLFICMPLKYYFGLPQGVKIVGMAHGLLFVAYVGIAITIAADHGWSFKKIVACLILSCLPFGTFYFESRYLK